MHSPTNLPTNRAATCCTVRVFDTGAVWISMLCAGLLTPIGWISESIALLCVFFALHSFACLLAFAFAWGPTLKILLWCDEGLPILDTPRFVRKMGRMMEVESFLRTAAVLVRPPRLELGPGRNVCREATKSPARAMG